MGKNKILSLPTKLKKFLTANKPLTYFLIFVAGLVFLAAVPYIKEVLGQIKIPVTVREYEINGSLVSTTLSENQSKEIVEFLRLVYPESVWPSQLSLQRQEEASPSNDEPHYGAWSSLGRVYNILYVKGASSQAKYLRTWILAPVSELNEEKAAEILSQSFNKGYLDRIGKPSCSEQAESDGSKFIVCSALTADTSMDKAGVLLRSPFKMQDGTEVVIVSACFFPKNSEIYSGSAFCL